MTTDRERAQERHQYISIDERKCHKGGTYET